ncbi:MAG TPA: ferritin-like domain-containing protein [Gaiellaceae bacterium]|nr:ferritin-like domain-containing protein [Gaiellaceae bacterium]
MSDLFKLEDVDVDGAIQESATKVSASTRAGFLKRAGIGVGTVVGAGSILGVLPELASATASSDTDILNFALTLEYLESAFYSEAVKKGALRGETRTFARVVAGHEAAHVAALKGALGSKAVAKPRFDFKGTTENQAKFQATSEVLEYTGVSAYLGQVGNITSKKVLGAAGSILPVEAWHAAWIADIRRHGGRPYPAPAAFAAGKTKSQILAAVKGTGFIVG